MILLADGGSTKVDWCLVDRDLVKKRVFTKGANPFFRTKEDISDEIGQVLLPELGGAEVEVVYFYGAGCAFPEKNEIVRAAIAEHFHSSVIEVGSDLLGAAVGLCKDEPGIACILGTGSNSCFYDGAKIVENVSPLGFILGDEGSGAVLGRLFIGACLKNQLTPGIKEEFFDFIRMDVPQILERVYKQPLPNRFLASVCPFIKEHIADNTLRKLVHTAFSDFFRKNVMQYDYRSYPVYFIGSVAYHFKDLLAEAAADCAVSIARIEKSPMDGLVAYHGARVSNLIL